MSERHTINLSTAWRPPSDGSRAWVRHFGRPSGIETGDRVWLVLESRERLSLVLNGVCLSAAIGRHDVTTLLEPRNELLLIPTTVEPGEKLPLGEVPPPAPSHGRYPLDPRLGHLHLEIEANVP